MKTLLACFGIPLAWLNGCGGDVESSKTAPPPSLSSHATGFVAVGRRDVLSSSDGVTWNRHAFTERFTPTAIAARGRRVVALGFAQSAAATQVVAVTDDLATWRSTMVGGGDCSLEDLAVVGDRFVAVGGGWNDGSCAFESADGETWRPLAAAPAQAMFHSLIRGSGEVLASAWLRSDLMTPMVYALEAGGFRKIGESTDRSHPAFVAGVALDEGRIAVVNGTGSIESWDDRSRYEPAVDGASSADATWHRIARGSGKLVVLGEALHNGVTEQVVGVRDESRGASVEVTLRRPGGGYAVAHGAGRFVVVGGRFIAHSTDGRTWTETEAPAADLIDVTALGSD